MMATSSVVCSIFVYTINNSYNEGLQLRVRDSKAMCLCLEVCV